MADSSNDQMRREIRFVPTTDDVIAYSRMLASQQRGAFWGVTLVGLAAGGVSFLLLHSPENSWLISTGVWVLIGFCFCLAAVGILGLSPGLCVFVFNGGTRKREFSEQVLTLHMNGISVATAGRTETHTWHEIDRIETWQDYAFVVHSSGPDTWEGLEAMKPKDVKIIKASRVTFFAVPLRAFPTNAAFVDFIQFAKQRHAAAQSSTGERPTSE